MKKILMSFVLIVFCSLISSCFSSSNKKEYDPTYYGETYGPMEIIDGLQVCLRTDGYYQVIGITDEAVHNGIIIIPQHINGIPVMGLGIPLQNQQIDLGSLMPDKKSEIAIRLYKLKEDIPLETYSSQYLLDRDVNNGYFFSKVLLDNQIKKIYISCHHMNYDPFLIKSNNNLEKKYGIIQNGYGAEQANVLLIYNYEKTNDYNPSEVEKGLSWYHYLFPNYNIISQYQYNIFLELVEAYVLEYAEQGQFIDEEDKNNKVAAERNNIIGQFKGIISNVEFHYNLIVDGVEYHNENNFSTDLYWIDYLNDGELLMEPPAPYIEGYDFNGWVKDSECSTPWNFNEDVFLITEEEPIVYLYAGWSKK